MSSLPLRRRQFPTDFQCDFSQVGALSIFSREPLFLISDSLKLGFLLAVFCHAMQSVTLESNRGDFF